MTISEVIAEYQDRFGTKQTLLALTIILDRMENEKGHGYKHAKETEITNLRTWNPRRIRNTTKERYEEQDLGR